MEAAGRGRRSYHRAGIEALKRDSKALQAQKKRPGIAARPPSPWPQTVSWDSLRRPPYNRRPDYR